MGKVESPMKIWPSLKVYKIASVNALSPKWSLSSRKVNAMSKLLVENPWYTLVSSHMGSACKVYATSPLQLLPMRTTPLSTWAIISLHMS